MSTVCNDGTVLRGLGKGGRRKENDRQLSKCILFVEEDGIMKHNESS
jgi:hypothetical protein